MLRIFLIFMVSFCLWVLPADAQDIPDSWSMQVKEDGSIDWGNGFTTIFGTDGSITKNESGQKIEIKDGKLQCSSAVTREICSQFTAYNSGLVEDLLTRILPAAGDAEPDVNPEPENSDIQPETIVLLEGNVPTVDQVETNSPPPPPAPIVVDNLEKRDIECGDCTAELF